MHTIIHSFIHLGIYLSRSDFLHRVLPSFLIVKFRWHFLQLCLVLFYSRQTSSYLFFDHPPLAELEIAAQARSPIAGMREASASSVPLADCRSEVLSMLIDFLYKSERPQGITCDNVLELFSWAIRCDLPELCDYCWDFIRNALGPDNVFSVLLFAIAHHLKKIK